MHRDARLHFLAEDPIDMWCSNCQQDAPAHATSQPRGYRCVRCAHMVEAHPAEDARGMSAVDDSIAAAPAAEPSLEADAWQWHERVARAERALNSGRRRALRVAYRRVDPSAAPADRWHDVRSSTGPRTPRQTWAWIVLAFGFAAFSCGVALLVWGKLSGRQDLQDVGLSTTLATQFAILVGLLLAVDSQEAAADAKQGPNRVATPHARPAMRRGQRFSHDANSR